MVALFVHIVSAISLAIFVHVFYAMITDLQICGSFMFCSWPHSHIAGLAKHDLFRFEGHGSVLQWFSKYHVWRRLSV